MKQFFRGVGILSTQQFHPMAQSSLQNVVDIDALFRASPVWRLSLAQPGFADVFPVPSGWW